MASDAVSGTQESSVFHAGEREVQRRLGVRTIEDFAQKVVRGYLPEQHREFYRSLPFLVVTARDEAGRPWVTLLTGEFISPDPKHLQVDARPSAGDPLARAFSVGTRVGILGIEFATRRRNRLNATVEALLPVPEGAGESSAAPCHWSSLRLRVDQAFGNCPQYIHERQWRSEPSARARAKRSQSLTSSQKEWISAADTFFIGTGIDGDPEDRRVGMDASHRGGEPGFVRVQDARRVVFPDYAGNNFFNTIGNLIGDARVGLTFVDFECGSLLQLSGRAKVDFDAKQVTRHPGTRRLVTIDIDEVIEQPGVLPLRFGPASGQVRSLRVVERVQESQDIISFHLEARDGGPLELPRAGQYLPVELTVSGGSARVRRDYSLSGPPSCWRYRISVKRQPAGLVSQLLHDQVGVGAIFEARAPQGEFLVPHGDAPLVLIAGGVGITPLLAMVNETLARQPDRELFLFHGVRNQLHHPFRDELRSLAVQHARFHLFVAYSRPQKEDNGHDVPARLSAQHVAAQVPLANADIALCGPTGFMGQLHSELLQSGANPERIFTESFGPQEASSATGSPADVPASVWQKRRCCS